MRVPMTKKEIANSPELRFWQHGVIFLLACTLVVSRRPDAVFHAQFWCEDGHVFFADAYNYGWWASMFGRYGGYFHAFPRLAASISLLVPLSLAPLVLNLIAIALQALPANLMLSFRSSVWGSLSFRAILAAAYLALPNFWEIDANITGSQWLLSIVAFLLLVAEAPRSVWGRSFDLCILTICSLTGPFSIFLLPIAIFLLWRHRDRWRGIQVSILTVGCLVQMWGLFNGGYSSRSSDPLGASPAMFIRLIAARLYLGTLIGDNSLATHTGSRSLIFYAGIGACGTIFVIICLLKSSLEMRLFSAFAGMILGAALVARTPGQLHGMTIWDALALGGGPRYFFAANLALAWLILWCVRSRNTILQIASAALLCILSFGVALQWRITAFQDMHFTEYAKRLDSAPVGTRLTIPQYPPGWDLRLVKH